MAKALRFFFYYILDFIFWGAFYIILLLLILPVTFTLFLIYLLLEQLFLYLKKVRTIRSLKPIIEEAKTIYGIDFVGNDSLTFYKNHHYFSVSFPSGKTRSRDVVREFKELSGSIDNIYFSSIRKDFDAITKLKKKSNNIFFAPLNNDSRLRKEIHLYDLSYLDEHELKSLLKIKKLSNIQKVIIIKKYLKNVSKGDMF